MSLRRPTATRRRQQRSLHSLSSFPSSSKAVDYGDEAHRSGIPRQQKGAAARRGPWTATNVDASLRRATSYGRRKDAPWGGNELQQDAGEADPAVTRACPRRHTELEPPPPSSQKHAPEAHILAPVAEAVAAAEVAP